jgi:vacuolar protein sorting-associated protein 45
MYCLPTCGSVNVRLAVFTNRVEDLRLQDLAESDVREAVVQVQEFFGDFLVLDPHHFLVPLPRPHIALQPLAWDYGNR